VSEKADNKPDADGNDTGERKKRRRKGRMRVPSDNVPRRASAPPVESDKVDVAASPHQDPKAAMSVLFGGDAGEAAGPAPASSGPAPTVQMPAVDMDTLAAESMEAGTGESVDIAFDDEATPAPGPAPRPPRAATQALSEGDWEEVLEQEMPSSAVMTSAEVPAGKARGKVKPDFDTRKTIPMPVITPEQIRALTGEDPPEELVDGAGDSASGDTSDVATADTLQPGAVSASDAVAPTVPEAPAVPAVPDPAVPAAASGVPVVTIDPPANSGPVASPLVEASLVAESEPIQMPEPGTPNAPVAIPRAPSAPVHLPTAEATPAVSAHVQTQPVGLVEPETIVDEDDEPSDGEPAPEEMYDAGDSGEIITDDLIEEVEDGADVVVDASASAGGTKPGHPPVEAPAPPPTPPAPPPKPAAKPPAPPAAAAKPAKPSKPAKPPPKAGRRRAGKPWFEEIFEEDYLRTLPFLTPQATQQEALFVLESLELEPGAQVLDVGCGYGRHAMEFAARGYHLVALDASLPLLLRGADEAQRRGLDINFVHGDMRELNFDAQFDGAYCLFSTFGYFDDELNKKAAQGIARSLKPGARFVIQILNRDYIIGDLPSRVWWEGDGCVVLEEVEFNYFSSRIHSNRSVVFDDGRQLEQEINLRAYSLHEFGKLLHASGFRVIEVSGSLVTKGRFFGNRSRDIIVVAERRGAPATAAPGSNAPATAAPATDGGATAPATNGAGTTNGKSEA